MQDLVDQFLLIGRHQLVKWKRGLRNRVIPRDGEPAIVVELLKEAIMDSERDPGSSYFREPLDIVLGVIDPDGDFAVFHYDRRRFEPWE